MPDRSTPMHAQIAAGLRRRIDRGTLTVGEAIPSERELARKHQVSRMTARQALMILESEGYVRRTSPNGTVVARRLPIRIGSFSDEVSRTGAEPGDRIIWAKTRRASAPAAQALGLNDGELVHAIKRLRTADGEAVAIETTYFPAKLTPGLLDAPLEGSLWAILRLRYEIDPSHSEAAIEVVTLAESDAKLLAARTAAAGILVTRRTFDLQGVCFEFATDIYRADRVRFEVEAAIPVSPSASS